MIEREVNRVVMLPPLVVVKLYSERWRCETECGALRLLRACPQAPALVGACTANGRAASVIRYVRGRSADWTSMTDLAAAIAALRPIHQIIGSGFGRLPAPGARTWSEFLDGRLAAYTGVLTQLGLVVYAKACHRLREQAAIVDRVTPHLLHSDPNPANVLIGKAGASLVDWELATYGDPQLDLVRLAWEWRLPVSRWRELVGVDPDSPETGFYRRLHLFSRLMSASTRPGPVAAALARRCLAELDECLRHPS